MQALLMGDWKFPNRRRVKEPPEHCTQPLEKTTALEQAHPSGRLEPSELWLLLAGYRVVSPLWKAVLLGIPAPHQREQHRFGLIHPHWAE